MSTLILNIETATNVCSVTLAENGKLLHTIETNEANVHSSKLTVFIAELFRDTTKNMIDLDAVAVSMGPGSYTGLRIGVSVTKGICFALDIPLIAVNTLQSLANSISYFNNGIDKNAWICPMIDARRLEVYAAFFDHENSMMKEVSADIIDEHSYKKILDNREVFFLGNGSEKCKQIIRHSNANFIDDAELSAKFMNNISFRKFLSEEFEDTAYFEPFYLKDFVATVAKKNIFK